MPRYNYECTNCLKKALKKHADKLTGHDDLSSGLPPEIFEEEVLFETSHSMNPSEEELKEARTCPRCGSIKCEKTQYGSQIHSYVRGYGWLDREGAKRDMNKFKLVQDDPYAEHRVPGEVDHIKRTLEKEGQHDPKTQHFPVSSSQSIEGAVKKAAEQQQINPVPRSEVKPPSSD
jgi:hypothetical protein